MRAVLLIGHGSLRPASGAAMIRTAARLREQGVAPIVAAGFLNFSQPTFTAALERCLKQGASEVIVMPYFLIAGKYVQVDLARLLANAQHAYPHVALRLAQAFGDHHALAELIELRALATPISSVAPAERGLLIMAHGSPRPASNAPIYSLAHQIEQTQRYAHVAVCFMELNQPSIATAIDTACATGLTNLVAVPFFVQLGGHVAADLPAAIKAGRQRHPSARIFLSEHLNYHPLLWRVIADRVAAGDHDQAASPPPRTSSHVDEPFAPM